jgi:O-acetyl-ADP-ribose deacetylase (regulator of RNase III)
MGYNLPARYVIHTVAPFTAAGRKTKTFWHAVTKTACNWPLIMIVVTIAFPAISCGVYGYPIDEAKQNRH